MKTMKAILIIMVIAFMYSCASVNAQDTIPECIKEKIEEIKSQPVANPPIHIYRYAYREKTVYYITAPCCDRYTTLVDENCTIICRPSGGITGKGDGKCTDFFEARTVEKLIWKDERTAN